MPLFVEEFQIYFVGNFISNENVLLYSIITFFCVISYFYINYFKIIITLV